MEAILKSKLNVKILTNTVYIISAILLPQVFHIFGMAGTVFLPMHIPVILAGFTLGPIYGLLAGVASPVISTMLTGMPVAFPMLPIMIFELGAYGVVSGLLKKYTKLPIILKLILTMLVGRIFYAVIFWIITMFADISANLSVVSAFITGIPGILIQLVLITSIIKSLNKEEIND